MELMTPDTGTLFWTALTFIVLLLILRKIAWTPILQMLEEREKKISDSLKEAERIRQQSEQAVAEQQRIIEQAKKEAQEIIAKGQKTAEVVKEEILAKAKAEAEKMTRKAQRDIELSRDKAIEQIQDLAVELSMAATEKLIGKSLDEKEHQKIIRESLSQLDKVN